MSDQVESGAPAAESPIVAVAAAVAELSEKVAGLLGSIDAQREWAGKVEKRLQALGHVAQKDPGPFRGVEPSFEQQVALFEALAKWQATNPSLDKTRTARVRSDKGDFTYKFADLSDVIEVAQTAAAFGLSTYQPQVQEGGQPVARAYLIHEGGGFIYCDAPIMVRQSGRSFSPGQDWAAAYSFSRRYAICGVLGIAAGEDDDDNARHSGRTDTRRTEGPAPTGAATTTSRPAAAAAGATQQRNGAPMPVRRSQGQEVAAAAPSSPAPVGHSAPPAAPGWGAGQGPHSGHG